MAVISNIVEFELTTIINIFSSYNLIIEFIKSLSKKIIKMLDVSKASMNMFLIEYLSAISTFHNFILGEFLFIIFNLV